MLVIEILALVVLSKLKFTNTPFEFSVIVTDLSRLDKTVLLLFIPAVISAQTVSSNLGFEVVSLIEKT